MDGISYVRAQNMGPEVTCPELGSQFSPFHNYTRNMGRKFRDFNFVNIEKSASISVI